MYTNLDSRETGMHITEKAYAYGQICALHNAGLVQREKVGMLLEKVAVEDPGQVDWDIRRAELAERLRDESDARAYTRQQESSYNAEVPRQSARKTPHAAPESELDVALKRMGGHKGALIGGVLGAGALIGGSIGAGLGSWSDEPGSMARGGMTGAGAGMGAGAGLLGGGAILNSVQKGVLAAEAAGKAPGKLGLIGKGLGALALPGLGFFGGGALGHWAGNKATGHTDAAAPRR